MAASGADDTHADLLEERRYLVALAFRMLGTIAEAEDAVQETYIRWYRLSEAERAAIEVPRAWLTRAASRVCLTMLTTGRRRHEQYVGPWLPEPTPAYAFTAPSGDPLDSVTLDESVSTALLVVLEAMTPAERVAFVLHDVFAMPFAHIAEIVGRTPAACRQLASSARRRVRQERATHAPRAEHDAVVRRFGEAARGGNLVELIAVLDPDVVLTSDGGGVVSAARRPVRGADNVARLLLGILAKFPEAAAAPEDTSDGLAFTWWLQGRIAGVLTVDVSDDRVSGLRMMMNPAKLTLWSADA